MIIFEFYIPTSVKYFKLKFKIIYLLVEYKILILNPHLNSLFKIEFIFNH